MKVTTPVTISMAFCKNMSPTITLPLALRLAAMVARAPLPSLLQASVLASPVSRRATQAGGACTKVCCRVRRLAGKSAIKLRGMITFWPPITIVPPDHTSAGLFRLTRSTSPVMKTWVGVAKKAARAAVARTGRVTRAQRAATAGLRILRTLALRFSTTTPLVGRAPERASRSMVLSELFCDHRPFWDRLADDVGAVVAVGACAIDMGPVYGKASGFLKAPEGQTEGCAPRLGS